MIGNQGKNLIDNQLNNITAKGHKHNATEKIEAGVEKESIVDFYTDLKRKNNKIFYVNIFIEVYGKTIKELEDKIDEVVSELSGYGVTVEHLSYEQREGFRSVYPLGEDKFKMSSNNMPTLTLASLHPFSFSSKNDPKGMLIGKTMDGGNMFVDTWSRTKGFTNGNFTIEGESGQGKSWLMKKILSQQIAMGTKCFELDPEGEYNDLIRSLGGTIINLANGKVKINPFEIRAFKTDDDVDIDKSDVDTFNIQAAFYQHLSWLKDFFKILIPAAGDKELAAAMIMIKDMYIRHGINERTDYKNLKSDEFPTFTNFYEYINDVYIDSSDRYSMISRDMLQSLLLLFKDPYDGSLGFLFNGHTNVVNYNLINYDLSDLLQGSKERTEAVLFNTMTYCWNRIAQRLGHTLLALDELYMIVNRNNYTTANYLKEFNKRARKYDAIIGTATQNLGDFLDPAIEHITSPIFNNPTYKFIFYPSDLDLNKVKNLLRLTDGEVNCIRTPNKGRCLFKAGGEKYYIEVGALPYEEKLFGSGGGR
jgi:type IV secretory pathway VirB4 component